MNCLDIQYNSFTFYETLEEQWSFNAHSMFLYMLSIDDLPLHSGLFSKILLTLKFSLAVKHGFIF